MMPDNVYVRKAVAGDAEAFDELIKRHRPKIYEVAHRIFRSAGFLRNSNPKPECLAYRYRNSAVFCGEE